MHILFRKPRLWLLIPLGLIVFGFAGLYTLDLALPFPRDLLTNRLKGSSTLIRAADATPLAWPAEQNPLRLPVRLEAVSPWLVGATIAVEDKRFRLHGGVDPLAVGRAFMQNLLSMRRVSGASTLTMQTIRLLQPRPRTWASKMAEAFRAWQLDRLLSKDEILEVYFSLAPYGDVVGAEAAAWRYFGKSAADLTLAEAALVAGLPQSPALLNPVSQPEAALKRRDFVIHRLYTDGGIDEGQAAEALNQPLSLRPAGEGLAAPHFVRFAGKAAAERQAVLDTTLDADLQRLATLITQRHAARLAAKNLVGVAAAVLATDDSSILAYIGDGISGADAGPDGMTRSMRSDSLFQPLVFALLADRGQATQAMVKEALGDTAQPAGADADWNLLHFANAYAALARNGIWMPVKVADDADTGRSQAVSPQAAWRTLSVLANPDDESAVITRVAHADTDADGKNAWAIVIGPEAVAAVWCGSGGNAQPLTDADILPLAEKLLEAVTRDRRAALSPPAAPLVAAEGVAEEAGENTIVIPGVLNSPPTPESLLGAAFPRLTLESMFSRPVLSKINCFAAMKYCLVRDPLPLPVQ